MPNGKIKMGKRRNPSFQKMGKGDRILCLLVDGGPWQMILLIPKEKNAYLAVRRKSMKTEPIDEIDEPELLICVKAVTEKKHFSK